MRKIKVVVLLVLQLEHGFTKNAKVSSNLTVAQMSCAAILREGLNAARSSSNTRCLSIDSCLRSTNY